MKQKHKDLIRYLKNQSKPITSTELVQQLGISARTVKSLIKEINEMYGQKIVMSCKYGYTLLNAPNPNELLTVDTLPQTRYERAHYIIKKILIGHKPIDIFDLCEELYVSYSTLKLNLSQMNKTFQRFRIKFTVKNGLLHIIGTENNKRRLISYVIFDETNSRFIDLKSLENTFAAEKIIIITSLVKNFFKSSDYYMNDFSFVNLILHFLILVERVQLGQYIKESSKELEVIQEESVKKLSSLLEEHFTIELSQNEKAQIGILINTYCNYKTPEHEDGIRKIVGKAVLDAVKDAILSINDVYMIDLNNDNFMPAFYLHIKGLSERYHYNTFNRNPMLEPIKRECRIIYDIAIYISIVLENQLEIRINEEETAFIALHVGAELERQKQNKQKVRVLLLCPDYYSMREKLYNNLNHTFGNEIYICAAVSSPSELFNHTFDLLISTIEIDMGTQCESIVIAPFRLDDQKYDISVRIEKARMNKKKQILKIHYNNFFDLDLFYTNSYHSSAPCFNDKNSLIRTVCNDMIRLGFVDESFEAQVRKREDASSTAFGELALPHSITMEAFKTCIAVIINKDGILWDGQKKVYVVLLTAINQIDRSHFTDIYEALISIFDHEGSIQRLKNITSFEDFADFIKNS